MLNERYKAVIGLTILQKNDAIMPDVFEAVGKGLRKYSEDQPRDENGRWEGGGSGPEGKADEANGGSGHVAHDLAESIRNTGGFTYSPVQGAPTTGFMVSIDPKESKEVDMKDMTGTKLEGAVQSYLNSKESILTNDTTKYAGAWISDENKCVFDISTHEPNKEAALKMGSDHNQDAIWDIVNMESIPCDRAKLAKKGGDKKGVHMVFGRDMTAADIAKAIAAKAVELGYMTKEQAAA